MRTPTRPTSKQPSAPRQAQGLRHFRAFAYSALLSALVCGCAGVRGVAPMPIALPTDHTEYRRQIAVYSDFVVPEQGRLIDDLAVLRNEVAAAMGLSPGGGTIHLFLFGERQAYEAYLEDRYPELPRRRAFFIQADGHLKVFAYRNPRLREDLRHEVVHAAVHDALGDSPLWFDEGLAECFEMQPASESPLPLHPAHAELLSGGLAAGRWRPNLARLEDLHSSGDMTQIDYAESWLWVHWLLSAPDRRELLMMHLGLVEACPAQPLADRRPRRTLSRRDAVAARPPARDAPPVAADSFGARPPIRG